MGVDEALVITLNLGLVNPHVVPDSTYPPSLITVEQICSILPVAVVVFNISQRIGRFGFDIYGTEI